MPLTSAQEAICRHHDVNDGSPFYNVGGYIELGRCDVDRIRLAHARLVETFDTFSMRISVDASGGYAATLVEGHPPLEVVDLSGQRDPDAAAAAWIEVVFSTAFRFDDTSLYRAALLRLRHDRHFYVGMGHHVLLDGAGFLNWGAALARFYEEPSGRWLQAYPAMTHLALLERETQYASSERCRTDAAWWEAQVRGFNDSLFPGASVPASTRAGRSGRVRVPLTDARLAQLHRIARRVDAEPHHVVMALLAVYFARTHRSPSVVVGSPVHGRATERERNSIALFVQMLPLRVGIITQDSLAALIKEVLRTQRQVHRHRRYPASTITTHPANPRSTSRPFDFAFSYLRVGAAPMINGAAAPLVYCPHGHEQHPLLVTYWEGADEESSVLLFDHNLDVIPEAQIGPIIQRVFHLLDQLSDDVEIPLGRLECVTPEEREQLLAEAVHGDASTAVEFDLHAHLQRQYVEGSGRIVLECGDERLDGAGLQARVIASAAALRQGHGVVEGDRVAVLLPPAPELVVILLAIMRLGAVYVPIDPRMPAARIQPVLDDSEPRLLIVGDRSPVGDSMLLAKPIARAGALMAWQSGAGSVPVVERVHDDPLYVLYTSGSTGMPKGVVVSWGALANLLGGFATRIQSVPGGRWLFASSPAFDISVVEWLACLCLGHTCVIPVAGQRDDPFQLASFLNDAGLSLVQATPSRLKQLMTAGWVPETGLCVVSAGEPLPPDLATCLLESGVVLWNGYGPTEATVYSLVSRVELEHASRGCVTIGAQLPGYRHYVLDTQQGLVPPGMPGELAIAGTGLALEYVNRPDLNGRQFVSAPALPEARLYRTGDIVTGQGGGCFRYLGRNDDQIKLRGYRIELGDIRAALCGIEGVRDAAVLHQPGDDQRAGRLIAYVCLQESVQLAQISAQLILALPEYMVPAQLTPVDAIPIGTNGKLDKARLPRADGMRGGATAPASDLERGIAALWASMLGVEPATIVRESSFFERGGDSVVATTLVARVRAMTGRQVTIGDLFRCPGLAEFAACVSSAPQQDDAPASIPRTHAPTVRLSAGQNRLWYQQVAEPGTGRYNMPVVYAVTGDIAPTRVEHALKLLVLRHESLHTRVRQAGEALLLDVVEPVQWCLDIVDAMQWAPAERAQRIEQALCAHADAPFDLERDLPFRALLIQQADAEALLALNVHHIAADGASVRVLFSEFLHLHAALARGEHAVLPDPVRQFRDVADWQRQGLERGQWAGQERYWRAHLDGAPPQHGLAFDGSRRQGGPWKVEPVESMLTSEQVQRVQAVARRLAVTEFSLMQCVFALLLCRWSHEDEVVVGSPVHGRGGPGLDGVVGMLVNLVAYRHRFDPKESFADQLGAFQQQVAQALEHQELPFDQVVDALQRRPEHGVHPVFQVMFAFQDDLPAAVETDKLALRRRDPATVATRFDLELLVRRGDAAWHLCWIGQPGLFERHSIRAMADAFVTLLDSVLVDPGERIGVIGPRAAWNLPGSDVPLPDQDICVHRLFERVAQSHPDAVALRMGREVIHYGALNQAANQLARLILARGLGPGRRVALCLPRGVDLIVATLAVLKAGCTYLAVDPAYPSARRQQIYDDAGPACILVHGMTTSMDEPDMLHAPLIVLDDPGVRATLTEQAPEDVPRAMADPTPLDDAYIVYTSGSTGRPKGARIAHRGLTNLARAQCAAFSIDARARVLQFSTFSFDASVSEWSTALISGAELVLVAEGVAPDAQALSDWINDHAVTHVTLPPTVLKRLQPHVLPTLTHAISAGEPIALDEATRWSRHCRFINAYGPSETTVCASIGGINTTYARVSIGQGMRGLHVNVLDRWLRPVELGAKGELCISGVGLANGYLNRPEETETAFVEVMTGAGTPLQLYRTGDLVRCLPDGDMLFEGRADGQVKVRGHRIECAEVERAIRACAEVRDVVVFVHDGAAEEPTLAACIVPASSGTVCPVALRHALESRLPRFMVPSLAYVVDALPLTPSGKIDSRRLKALGPASSAPQTHRALTTTEQGVQDIWAGVLHGAREDPDNGFFSAGGHSLQVADVLAGVRERFGVSLGYRQFFQTGTIATLAALIDAQARGDGAEAVPGMGAGTRPMAPTAMHAKNLPGTPVRLSFEQQRLWFIDQMEGGSCHYNMAVTLHLEGDIDPPRIQMALDEVLQRHESLRTVFGVDDDGVPLQWVIDAVFQLQVLQGKGGTWDADVHRLRTREQTTPFDLRTGPLIRATLLQDDAHAALFLTMHHIAADGWSVDRLIADFARIYATPSTVGRDALPPLPLQYRQFAESQRRWADAGGMEAGLEFWTRRLAGAPPRHSLPRDGAEDVQRSPRGMACTTHVPGALADRMRGLARAHDTSLFVLLHAAFAVLVGRWSESGDVLIATPVANRHQPDLDALIGFFANTVVLRTDCTVNRPFVALLEQARREFTEAFEHQHVPFDAVVEAVSKERVGGSRPLAQILFSVQDDPARKLRHAVVDGMALRVLEEDGECQARFDLELMVSESDDGLRCRWTFDTAVFQEATVRRMAGSFLHLLHGLSEDAATGIRDLEIVTVEERRMLMAPARTFAPGVMMGSSILDRFARIVVGDRHAPAIIDGDRVVDYAELDARSTRLCTVLSSAQLDMRRPMAIHMRRGVDLVVAMLAVMKAGAPYLPLDLAYPAERVAFILADARASALLCDAQSLEQLSGVALPAAVFCHDEAGNVARSHAGAHGEPAHVDAGVLSPAGSLAYVVYTSGSTGQPKGVMVRQDSFLNLLHWYIHDHGLSPSDRCLLVGSIGFDMTQKNVFAPLLSGGTIVIPDDMFDPEAIASLVSAHKVTLINCAPSAAGVLVASDHRWPALASLRILAMGGEAVRLADLHPWLHSGACHATIVNMYGPSECTDIGIAAIYDADAAASHNVTLPIGRPIQNCTAYVLSSTLKLQPFGVVGDLYLGGIGVSDGYIDRDDLTRQSFLTGVLPGEGMLYATGDLARITPDGVFHYVGRTDGQVKIRGFRVATAEIDAIIAGVGGVAGAVTVAREGAFGDAALVAFVVLHRSVDGQAQTETDAQLAAVHAALVRALPAFMVPAALVPRDVLPLTPNGKIDRRLLEREAVHAQGWHRPQGRRVPSTQTEARLLALWRELLGHDRIGMEDDFFQIGGHSLLATRLTSRVTHEFGLDGAALGVREFFLSPTISGIAALVDARTELQRVEALERRLAASGVQVEEGDF
nr:non-ribosomal peptide synthetase [Luteimonas sp. XNQY3]